MQRSGGIDDQSSVDARLVRAAEAVQGRPRAIAAHEGPSEVANRESSATLHRAPERDNEIGPHRAGSAIYMVRANTSHRKLTPHGEAGKGRRDCDLGPKICDGQF